MNKLYFIKKGNQEGLFVLCKNGDCYGFLEQDQENYVLLQGSKQAQGYEFLIGAEEFVLKRIASQGIYDIYGNEESLQPVLRILPMDCYCQIEEEKALSKRVLEKFFSSMASILANQAVLSPQKELIFVKQRQEEHSI